MLIFRGVFFYWIGGIFQDRDRIRSQKGKKHSLFSCDCSMKFIFFIHGHGVCGKKHPIFAEHIDMSENPKLTRSKVKVVKKEQMWASTWNCNHCNPHGAIYIYMLHIYITLYIRWFSRNHMDISKNRGTPKSSILIGFSIINHPFWGTPIFGNNHMINQYL